MSHTVLKRVESKKLSGDEFQQHLKWNEPIKANKKNQTLYRLQTSQALSRAPAIIESRL